jgi:hypothetical protein
MQRYLEERAPCIYLPTFDWRHSSVIPRLGGDVLTVASMFGDDATSLEHVRRLEPYLSAVVTTNRAAARMLRRRAPSLADRVVMIPEGHHVPDTLPPLPRRDQLDPVRLLVCAASSESTRFDACALARAAACRGFTLRVTSVGSADNPELPLPELAAHADLPVNSLVWPVPSSTFERTEAVLLGLRHECIPAEAWEAMGAGCVPLVVNEGKLPAFLRDGENCFVIEPGAVETLADRLMLLARDPGRHATMRQRAHTLAWHGATRLDSTLAEYEELFDRLLRGNAAGRVRRRVGPISPPPARVSGVEIFPVPLWHWRPRVGRFPSRADYHAYRFALRGETHAQRRTAYPEQGARPQPTAG